LGEKLHATCVFKRVVVADCDIRALLTISPKCVTRGEVVRGARPAWRRHIAWVRHIGLRIDAEVGEGSVGHSRFKDLKSADRETRKRMRRVRRPDAGAMTLIDRKITIRIAPTRLPVLGILRDDRPSWASRRFSIDVPGGVRQRVAGAGIETNREA